MKVKDFLNSKGITTEKCGGELYFLMWELLAEYAAIEKHEIIDQTFELIKSQSNKE